MCMKCGCSTPNDKIVAKPIVAPNGSSGTMQIVPATDATPGGYDYDD
jgi:hypothetical protein